MSNVARDLAEAIHQSLDAIQHLVEVLRKLIELISGAARRHPISESAIDDRSSGTVDLVNAAQKSGPQRRSADNGEENSDCQSPAEGADNGLAQLGQTMAVHTNQEKCAIGKPGPA